MGDEGGDQRFGDSFAVLNEPGRESCGDDAGRFRSFHEALLVAGGEGRLNSLEEGEREAVALVYVGDVDVETGFGVVVGEETEVF